MKEYSLKKLFAESEVLENKIRENFKALTI